MLRAMWEWLQWWLALRWRAGMLPTAGEVLRVWDEMCLFVQLIELHQRAFTRWFIVQMPQRIILDAETREIIRWEYSPAPVLDTTELQRSRDRILVQFGIQAV